MNVIIYNNRIHGRADTLISYIHTDAAYLLYPYWCCDPIWSFNIWFALSEMIMIMTSIMRPLWLICRIWSDNMIVVGYDVGQRPTAHHKEKKKKWIDPVPSRNKLVLFYDLICPKWSFHDVCDVTARVRPLWLISRWLIYPSSPVIRMEVK